MIRASEINKNSVNVVAQIKMVLPPMNARVTPKAFAPLTKIRSGKQVTTIARLKRADMRTMRRRLGTRGTVLVAWEDHRLLRWRVHSDSTTTSVFTELAMKQAWWACSCICASSSGVGVFSPPNLTCGRKVTLVMAILPA